jgi:hypothetical protein
VDVAGARAPASPRLRTVDGVTAWFVEDQMWRSIGGNTIRNRPEGEPRKIRGVNVVQSFEAIDRSAWDVKERLELLDQSESTSRSSTRTASAFLQPHLRGAGS